MTSELPPGIDDRARAVLGLDTLEQEPRALAIRAEHLWRAEHFARKIPFTGSFVLPIDAGTDGDVLAQSVAQIAGRHDGLHSRLALRGGRAILLPQENATPAFEIVAAARADIAAFRDNRAGSPLTEFFAAPFDLLEDTGLRVRGFRDETGQLHLGVLMHHFFGDAWSSQILRREIEAACRARTLGVPADLPPVTQYSDYALFQRRALASTLPQHLGYWHGRLKDMQAADLPFEAMADQNMLGRAYYLIGKDVMTALAGIAREERMSLGIICFAAFQVALAAWRGAAQTASSTQSADRIRPQFRDTIGHLLSAIAIHSRIDPDMAFRTFLLAFAREFYSGLAHQDVSFELYEEIFAAGRPFRLPHFNFVPRQESFFIGNSDDATPDIRGVQPAPDMRKMGAYRDLHFLMLEYPGGLVGRAVYNKNMSLSQITALIQIYQRALTEIARDRHVRLGALV